MKEEPICNDEGFLCGSKLSASNQPDAPATQRVADDLFGLLTPEEESALRAAPMTNVGIGKKTALGLINALRDERTASTAKDARIAEQAKALAKINVIRNSIIGLQKINWSEHIYPLVAALNDAGIEGMDYDEARGLFGTMLDRTNAAEDRADHLTAELAALKSAGTREDGLREAAGVADAIPHRVSEWIKQKADDEEFGAFDQILISRQLMGPDVAKAIRARLVSPTTEPTADEEEKG